MPVILFRLVAVSVSRDGTDFLLIGKGDWNLIIIINTTIFKIHLPFHAFPINNTTLTTRWCLGAAYTRRRRRWGDRLYLVITLISTWDLRFRLDRRHHHHHPLPVILILGCKCNTLMLLTHRRPIWDQYCPSFTTPSQWGNILEMFHRQLTPSVSDYSVLTSIALPPPLHPPLHRYVLRLSLSNCALGTAQQTPPEILPMKKISRPCHWIWIFEVVSKPDMTHLMIETSWSIIIK